jgi:hypothetical protein
MPPSRSQPSPRVATFEGVVDHAREIADLSDRWFLGVAARLGRAGVWARREADIVADSAVAAFATTMMVAKKVMSLATIGLEGPGSGSSRDGNPENSLPSLGQEVALDLVSAASPDEGDARGRVDLMVAERLGIEHDSRAAANEAGVVPLLQALGRTIATHAQAGYASLQEDRRFWTLVHLVQTTGRPSIAPLRSEADGWVGPTGEPFPSSLEGEASSARRKDLHDDPQ